MLGKPWHLAGVCLEHWRVWHQNRHWRRRTAKVALVAVVLLLCLYPKIWLIPTWIGRLSNMNGVLDPQHLGLAPLEAEVRERVAVDANPQALLSAVQAVVNQRVPYEFDWNLWGVMDWLPTVEEALRAGREDCDGRAVVAASLLRRMGHKAWLVSDFTHTWVACDLGETMAPRNTAKSMVADEQGTQTRMDLTILNNLLHSVAFGITVFPPLRLLIFLSAVVFATANPFVRAAWQLLGAGAIFAAYAGFLIAARYLQGGEKLPMVLVAALLLTAFAGWCAMSLRFKREGRPGDSAATQIG